MWAKKDLNKDSKDLIGCSYCTYCYSCYGCYGCSYCSECYYCASCLYCSSCFECYYCSNCYFSVDLRMSEDMIFCLGSGAYAKKGEGYQKNHMVFNKQVSSEEFKKVRESLPAIKLEPKNPNTFGYKAAWQNWWNEATKEDRGKIINLPQFDAKIFTEITGITNLDSRNLTGKTMIFRLDGIEYTATIN